MIGNIARATAAFAAAAAAIPSGARPPVNEVPIRITWTAIGPQGVAFEDASGRRDFAPGTNYFEGARRAEGVFATHRVALTYRGSEALLPIRTRYNLGRLTLRVDGPTASDCTADAFRRLAAATESSSPAVRIRTMLQAHHMLTRAGTVCSAGGRDQLAATLFRMNCSLARTEDYIELSDEVVALYVRHSLDRTAADQAVRECRKGSRAAALRTLVAASAEANAESNYAQAAVLSGELLALASDPDWGEALESVPLGPPQTSAIDYVRAVHVDNLYDGQRQLAERGEYDAALQLNEELRTLLARPGFGPAFNRVRIDSGRLSDDRSYILARMPAARPMNPPSAARIQAPSGTVATRPTVTDAPAPPSPRIAPAPDVPAPSLQPPRR